MKYHVTWFGLLLGLMLPTLGFTQDITREQAIAIHNSLIDSVNIRDFLIYEKYLYADSEFDIDMDPAPNNKLLKVELKEFKKLAVMSLQMAEEISLENELVRVEINRKKTRPPWFQKVP